MSAELETVVASVEERLTALGDALRERDSASIDLHATELHRALADAVDHFARAARSGALPPALRTRLARAGGKVAAHRESLARAMAALDRAIDVLMPNDSAIYSSLGGADRGGRGGAIQA
jgi:ABC-type transporter Mla subunit MlaD